jgi:hypothetical protein
MIVWAFVFAYLGGAVSATLIVGIITAGARADLGDEINRLRQAVRDLMFARDSQTLIEARLRASQLLNMEDRSCH